MTEIQFYHLTATPPERALPRLLEKALAAGHRVVLRLASAEQMEEWNRLLWTYDPNGFLPHGAAADGNAAHQPIYLTIGEENPNNADVLVVTDAAVAVPPESVARLLCVFHGADGAVAAQARERAEQWRAAGHAVTYRRQNAQGGWEEPAGAA